LITGPYTSSKIVEEFALLTSPLLSADTTLVICHMRVDGKPNFALTLSSHWRGVWGIV
jgi:hypothetical protein